MNKINFLSTNFVVIGAGKTGLSVINYLHYRKANILRVLDTRIDPPAIPHVNVIGGKLDYQLLSDADVVVISPGVSIYEPVIQLAISHGKMVVGDIELFAQAIITWPSKVIGITGSNGKTTVTSLVGFLAQQAGINTLIAGNIGDCVLDELISIKQTRNFPELIVLELSSFQLETTYTLKLNAATVLNISADHLDRYSNLLDYAHTKSRIFANCMAQVLNYDDPLVMAMQFKAKQTIFFGTANCAYTLAEVFSELILQINGEKFINTNELKLLGQHNYLNCLASLALLAASGYDVFRFAKYLAQFAGLEHRMQKIAEHNGITYIEDSKATNVGAVVAGLSGIKPPLNLILGGDGKEQDFDSLRDIVLSKCRSVALIGKDAQLIAKALVNINIPISKFKSLPEAVLFCIQQAQIGDVVILSPACASLDMFSDYKHRAKVFSDTVHEFIQKKA